MDDEWSAMAAGSADDVVARLRARLAEYDDAPAHRLRGLRRLHLPSWPSWSSFPDRASLTRCAQRLRRHWVGVGLAVAVGGAGIAAGGIALGAGGGRSSATPSPPAAAATPGSEMGASDIGASDRGRVTVRSTTTMVSPTTVAVLTRIPGAWRSSCRPAPALDPHAQSALVCAPTAGIALEVRAMAPASSGAALARLVPATVPERNDAACASGLAERRAWSTPKQPQVIAGRFACFRTTRGAELVWSIDRDDTVLRAVRADGDLAALFGWWEQAPL